MASLIGILGNISIGVFATLVAGIIFQPIPEKYVGFTAIKLLAQVRKKVSPNHVFDTAWVQEWEVKSANYPTTNPGPMKIHKFGCYLACEFNVEEDGDANAMYRIFARIRRHNEIAGIWYSRRSEGYVGYLQLMLAGTGDKATGCWIGESSEKPVKSGTWQWRRL